MSEVIPAILPADLDDLATRLAALRGVAPLVQIDVVDGVFAPRITWPYNDLAGFNNILAEEKGLPFWEEFAFEADLMVEHARRDAEGWVSAGASRVIVHAESRDAEEALVYLQGHRGDSIFSVSAGVALSIETPLEALARFEGKYDFVQLMGIAYIGKQSEPLDERIYARLEELRSTYRGTISVDGGVKQANARRLVRAGATALVAGSAILSAQEPKAAYESLLSEMSA
jgi:ribulose-phosphate 3-epimerase